VKQSATRHIPPDRRRVPLRSTRPTLAAGSRKEMKKGTIAAIKKQLGVEQ
jgi:hypothetical protein